MRQDEVRTIEHHHTPSIKARQPGRRKSNQIPRGRDQHRNWARTPQGTNHRREGGNKRRGEPTTAKKGTWEPLLGTLGTFTWEPGNLYLGAWEPYLGTLAGNLGTFTWEPGKLGGRPQSILAIEEKRWNVVWSGVKRQKKLPALRGHSKSSHVLLLLQDRVGPVDFFLWYGRSRSKAPSLHEKKL